MRKLVGLVLLLASAALGQTFDVASVKPHDGPMRTMGLSATGNEFRCDACSLRMLVMYAYKVKEFQVTGTPSLVKEDNTRWDVVAKAGGQDIPKTEEFRKMLRALLADRFQLKLHHETRDTPVYALVVGKEGPKFQASDPDANPMGHQSGDKDGNNLITLPKATMSDVTSAIANAMLDRPVVDQTGLTGTYNIKLTYTPTYRQEPQFYIGVFDAVEQQLGLKLEKRTAPVDMLVVDNAQKPAAN